MKFKKWSLAEKLEILGKSEELGIVEACRKYSVSTGTFYSWKKKLLKLFHSGLIFHLYIMWQLAIHIDQVHREKRYRI